MLKFIPSEFNTDSSFPHEDHLYRLCSETENLIKSEHLVHLGGCVYKNYKTYKTR